MFGFNLNTNERKKVQPNKKIFEPTFPIEIVARDDLFRIF